MRASILYVTLLFVLTGCTTLTQGGGGFLQRYSLSRDVSAAKSQLEKGDRNGAITSLTAVVEAGSYPGVTDEALFLLALLNIRPSVERYGNLHSLQLLKRLKSEFPASPWTSQSGQLLDLLNGVEELRRQVKSLKSKNQSLSNEANELNRSIDQLKQLDQELERIRR